jgi:hypothetical protein
MLLVGGVGGTGGSGFFHLLMSLGWGLGDGDLKGRLH